MHDGIADAVHDGFVHLGFFTDQRQVGLLAQLLAHVPDDAVHLLERAGYRDHPQRHGDVLQFVGKLAQLPRGFCKGIQL